VRKNEIAFFFEELKTLVQINHMSFDE